MSMPPEGPAARSGASGPPADDGWIPPPPGPGGPGGPGGSGRSGRSTGLWSAIAVAAVLVLIVGFLVLDRVRTEPGTSSVTPSSRAANQSSPGTGELRPGLPGGPDGTGGTGGTGGPGATVPSTDAPSTPSSTDPNAPNTSGGSSTATTTGGTNATSTSTTTTGTGIPTPATDRTPSATTGSRATRSTTSAPAPSTTTTTPAALTPAQQLAAWRTASLRGLVLDGRWVIQLASKYDGIVDPRQIAANGTHTFGLSDIVAEITALQADPRYAGQRFLVLNGTDFDSNRRYAAPLWITLVDPGGLSTRTATLTWCRMKNPGMDDSTLLNICYPRQLLPVS